MFGRRSCRPMSRHSIPLIFMLPFGSASLKNEATKEDLPAPVRPTIPIYLKRMFLHIIYLVCTLAHGTLYLFLWPNGAANIAKYKRVIQRILI